MRKPIFALTALFLLASCGVPRVVPGSNQQVGLDTFYRYSAAGRDLNLEIVGSPFAGVSEREVGLVVQDSILYATSIQPPTRPRLDPGPSARPGYRLVFAFNPGTTVDDYEVCAGQAQTAQPSPGPSDFMVIGVWCHENDALSSATGYLSGVSSPEDPRFQHLMELMALEIFDPREDRRQRRDDRRGSVLRTNALCVFDCPQP